MAEKKETSSGWKLLNDLVQLIGLIAVLSGLWRATVRVDKVERRQDAADSKLEDLQTQILEKLNERRKQKADSI